MENNLRLFFNELKKQNLVEFFSVTKKADNSLLTDLDLKVHDLFFKFCERKNINIPIISEETAGIESKLLSPPAFVIDPIDGTKGLVDGTGEWSISIAYLEELSFTRKNIGVIYHPLSGELYDLDMSLKTREFQKKVRVYVSRTEFKQGLYADLVSSKDYDVIPMGSIALKLAKLYAGECDLVITRRPKNIWDIAAGIALLASKPERFFISQNGKVFNSFTSDLTYSAPMIFGIKKEEKRALALAH